MKRSNISTLVVLLIVAACSYRCGTTTHNGESQPIVSLNQWHYIQVDDQRAKWGDWAEPEWLRYFGLDMADVTGDGFKDIVAGRYFYQNPGGDMTEHWHRIDLGMNVDGMLFVDVKGHPYGGIIATALPAVYWFKALDEQGSAWQGVQIGEVPATGHVNGQGYANAQIIPGGSNEVMLATGEGIYYFEIPEDIRRHEGYWPMTHAAPDASDEGFGIGDIDGDGLLDIAAGRRQGEGEGSGMEIFWWKNPGNGQGNWESFPIGQTLFDADRIAVADMNGDGKADVVVSEERYPGQDPDANLFWFEQPGDLANGGWERHTIVTQYSMNNMDVADVDNDGHMDIIVAEHKGKALKLQIWRNDGTGNFTENLVDTGKEGHLGARVADLDGNGTLDIISIGWDKYPYLHVWRNDGLGATDDAQ